MNVYTLYAGKPKKENGRLRITTGVTNPKLGITPDMEVGHLYHCNNDIDELAGLGQMIGISPSWIQNRVQGLAHFDVYGAPLKDAKKLFKVVSKEEVYEDLHRIGETVKEELESIKQEVEIEYKAQDLIVTNLGYVSFVSKSKGKGRRRRNWKEVELYRFSGFKSRGEWHTERKARFDEMTEIMSKQMEESPISGDDLMWWAKRHCDRKGGKGKGIY